jgi:hypothetical protein
MLTFIMLPYCAPYMYIYGCTLWGHPAHRAPKLFYTMRIYHTMYMNAIGTPRTCCNAVKYHVDIHNVTLLCTLHVYGCTLWDDPAYRAPKLLHTMRIYQTMYMNAIGTPRTCFNAETRHVKMHAYTYLAVHVACIWVLLMRPPCTSSAQALAHDEHISYDVYERHWHTENVLQSRDIPG